MYSWSKNYLRPFQTFWEIAQKTKISSENTDLVQSKIILTRPNYFGSGPKSISFFPRKDLIQLYVVNIECIELDKEDKQYINALC